MRKKISEYLCELTTHNSEITNIYIIRRNNINNLTLTSLPGDLGLVLLLPRSI